MASQVLELTKPLASKAKRPVAGTVHWLNECIERGKREVFSEITVATPGLANVILAGNPDNRNIRATKLGQFAADMRKGSWVFNGEPIIIAKTGELNDGQHRLLALIEANTSQPFLFVFGLERDTRLTVDQGAARTASDFLNMEGVENASNCASIARIIIAVERENYQRLYREGDVTNAEIRARVEIDEQIGEAAHYAAQTYRYSGKLCAPGVVGAAFYLLSDVSSTDARDYMDRVCIGENLKRTDPAYAVRDALLALGRGQKGGKLEAIFRGWVKFRCKQPLKIAKVLGTFPALV